MEKDFFVDQLHINICNTRTEMGKMAAIKAGKKIISLLQSQPTINIIFAAAPSQNEFLDALIQQPGINWEKINALHMDEYIGLPKSAPQNFGNYLNNQIFKKVPFRTIHLINEQETDPEAVCESYARLLLDFPPDIVFMGIGENGHIAFNDPHVANFKDPKSIKIIDLDLTSRKQQVNDGCFSELNQVPERAATLTIPTLLSAKQIFCTVPGKTKARAVYNTLNRPIDEQNPSTVLRTHPSAELFLDADSSELI